ncbi:ATP-binding protein [Sphingomonas sp. MG17]|uniref:histidine kinase n=1 Tax=Sphingomonas tagetis TaxID=2949092 RepID=A0A9X2HSH2_9SPHN|nr:ATP-binding protein [Sphingomonas tagetis]MCP3731070.1 ATP-binding protein [Sphingomonas tagetis]
MLRDGGLAAEASQTLPGFIEALRAGAGFAVVTEEALRGADLRELDRFVRDQADWSDFPFIVLTERGGGLERNPGAVRLLEALGNVTFLERPFHPTTLLSLARSALRARLRQYDARKRIEDIREREARQAALLSLSDRLRTMDDAREMSFAAAETLGTTLGVSRAGYGVIDPAAETITIERDWNQPGTQSLAGVLHFRDYGSYIEDLKRGTLVAIADAREDPRTAATAGALEAIHARAVFNMPLVDRGDFTALLYLNHIDAREWTGDDKAFVRDVADRTQAAIDRRNAEQSLADLANTLERQVEERTRERDRNWQNSQDLLAVISPDGRFLAVNPAWTTILGWRAEEIVGRDHVAFSHPEDQEGSSAAHRHATERELNHYENRVRHKDGSYRWFSWIASPDGGVVYASGRHITAEKEAQFQLEATQAQLRQAQKMEAVGQLTGGLAHDFNNLLTGISGSLELIQIRIQQGRGGEIDRYLGMAQQAAKRAAALTHRLLAFSRRQTLDPKPTNINRLIANLEDFLRRSVGPAVEIEMVGAGGLWTALIDPPQLENALLNLCINARDAMPDGGRITIETANKWLDQAAARERELPPGQYVSLCVTDTGSGMSAETIERVFDPFFTTKPLGEGTGLGLSMIYGFVRQSGGQVRIYSELGQGTTMCLYFPRVHMNEASEEGSAPQEVLPSPAGETVLIVDDEPAIRLLVTDVLAELGYNAIEAGDGPAGLAILNSPARIDLLVTDVGLPKGMNGRQLADAARVGRPDLKVLFITGYAENAVVGNGQLEPGMHVLTKPFAMEGLANRIRTLITE